MLESKYQSADLSLKIFTWQENNSIAINFTGKSHLKDPDDLIGRILRKTFEICREEKKSIALNFSKLEFMKNGTVSPVIRLWSMLKKKGYHCKKFMMKKYHGRKPVFQLFQYLKKSPGYLN